MDTLSYIIIGVVAFILLFIFLPWFVSGIKILQEYERALVFRFGRFVGMKGPGLIWVIPSVDKTHRVQLRTVTYDARMIHVITKDNVRCDVDSVIYYKVINPEKAILEIENYRMGVENISKTILRDVLGHADLDDLLGHTEELTLEIQEELDKKTADWGIKVVDVAISDVLIPNEMLRAIAKQAEAERERRARSIVAEGEQLAARKMTDAAMLYAQSPISLKLRELQTYSEIAREKNLIFIANASNLEELTEKGKEMGGGRIA